MKKIAISFAILFLTSVQAYSSHLLGGEITWECITHGNDKGKIIFKMRLYRACTGISNPTSVSVNNPLYAAYGGPSSITATRKSTRDMSPRCFADTATMNCYISGRNSNAVEECIYESNPATIYGQPSKNGSAFWWSSCCRPAASLIQNINGSGYWLRAVMFPYVNVNGDTLSIGSSSVGPTCYDASPEFSATPSVVYCARRSNENLMGVVDLEGDSLALDWTDPMQGATNPVTWKNSYAVNSQLPGTSLNTNNVPALLDNKNSSYTFRAYGPIGGYHVTAVKASAYKNGQKVAEVYRDLPIVITNCDDTISRNPMRINQNPTLSFKANGSTSYSSADSVEVIAGDIAEMYIRAEDLDLLNAPTLDSQSVSIEVFGKNFSGNCLSNYCALIDTTYGSGSIYKRGGYDTSIMELKFKWQTHCSHLYNPFEYSGFDSVRTYRFYVRVRDNYCLLPGETVGHFDVKIRYDNTAGELPIRKIDASHGGARVYWNVSQMSSFSFYNLARGYGSWNVVANITNIQQDSFYDNSAITHLSPVAYRLSHNYPICTKEYNATSIFLSLSQKYNDTVVYLNWNSPYVGQWHPKDYKYYVYKTEVPGSEILVDSLNTNYYEDKNVKLGKTYYYKIRSNDKYGFESISNRPSFKVVIDTSGNPGTGIETNIEQFLNLYPNPFSNQLTLDLPSSSNQWTIRVYDVLGNVHFDSKFEAGKHDLELGDLKSGVYFVQYDDGQGNAGVKRMVKME